MIIALTFLCFISVPLALGEKIHQRMTDEEVKQVFQTSHVTVPDYEVVQFHVSRLIKRGTRSARSLRVKAFGEDLKLWLQPSEGILAGKKTPVFIVRNDSSGKIVYDDYANAMNNVGKLLEDSQMKASLIVGTDSYGLYSMNGFIASKNLIVKSLPESISENLMTNRSSENPNSKITKSAYHIVYRREIKHLKENSISLGLNGTRNRRSASTTVIPDVVYPEIMVVVDSTYMSLNNNDIDNILAYIVAFWNGVDLAYRSFEEPKFRFNIARVIIAKEQNALPYIFESMVDKTIYNAYKALDSAENYYFQLLKKFPVHTYDAVVTMSRLDMGYGGLEPDILGIMSKRGGACLVDYKQEIMMNVALITDTGSFDGVFTAAHEFAHLLGAGHDDWVTCRPKDGYIMSSTSGITEHSHDFSDCTVEDIQEYLNNNGGTCLYNVPKTTNPLPRVLPGQLRDRDYQCKMLGRGKSCYNEAKNQLPCTAIYCRDPEDPSRCLETTENAPADGVFCSNEKICLHGKCTEVQRRH